MTVGSYHMAAKKRHLRQSDKLILYNQCINYFEI